MPHGEQLCFSIVSVQDIRALNNLTALGAHNMVLASPSFPLCEIKGLVGKKRDTHRTSELSVYEDEKHRPFYTIRELSLSDSYLLPFFSISEDAMMLEIDSRAVGVPQRRIARMLREKSLPKPQQMMTRSTLTGRMVRTERY